MKRDFELIKEILLEIEKSPKPSEWVKIDLEYHSEEETFYHIKLLRKKD